MANYAKVITACQIIFWGFSGVRKASPLSLAAWMEGASQNIFYLSKALQTGPGPSLVLPRQAERLN